MFADAGDLLEVQGSLLLHPVGEDVPHGAALLVEAQVEPVGVDLGAVRHLEHRLEADALLPCGERGGNDGEGQPESWIETRLFQHDFSCPGFYP